MTRSHTLTRRTSYTVTVCVLLHREGRWLLTVRGAKVAYAPGTIGMVGGHLEQVEPGTGVLEAAGRREVLEETGIDLGATSLRYLESSLLPGEAGTTRVSVTFVGRLDASIEPTLAAPEELAAVGWWTEDELGRDPRCPDWLPPLIRRATLTVGSA